MGKNRVGPRTKAEKAKIDRLQKITCGIRAYYNNHPESAFRSCGMKELVDSMEDVLISDIWAGQNVDIVIDKLEASYDLLKGTAYPSCKLHVATKDLRTCSKCGKAKGCVYCFVVANTAIDSYWCRDCSRAAKNHVSSEDTGGIMTCPNCGAKGLKTTDLKDCTDCGRTGCVKCFEDEFCQPCDDARARKVLSIVDPVKAASSRNPIGDLAQSVAEEQAKRRKLLLRSQGEKEAVNHPAYYNAGTIEVIDVIEDWKMGFCLGNVIKYVGRADYKGHALEDLKKAAWYLQREIERRQKQASNPS